MTNHDFLAEARELERLEDELTYEDEQALQELRARKAALIEKAYQHRKAELAAEAARLAADPPALPSPPDRQMF